ncbi:hypothetical protein A3Q56_06527 [Intoshia linei]|uniref:Myeloid leukemia factor 1 n=1 Tax=Intoshia linei TaxID=1819745 RepID=A0A177AUS7_9BILA|nr:hypothetical protein A3Q56_06527 [Intoshia linei]
MKSFFDYFNKFNMDNGVDDSEDDNINRLMNFDNFDHFEKKIHQMKSMMNFKNFDNEFKDLFNNKLDCNTSNYYSSVSSTYQSNKDGKPHIIKKSYITKGLPGGLKETRKMKYDNNGENSVEFGRYLNDKSHIIKKIRDKSGREHVHNDYNNMDESETNKFHSEFKKFINGDNDFIKLTQKSRALKNNARKHSKYRTNVEKF